MALPPFEKLRNNLISLIFVSKTLLLSIQDIKSKSGFEHSKINKKTF